MKHLHFYIRHQTNFLRDKMILVFKSNEAKEFFEQSIPDCHFEAISAASAEHAIRLGIQGKMITYGYTLRLTDDEMNELSTANWTRTAELLAEGNERLYRELVAKKA